MSRTAKITAADSGAAAGMMSRCTAQESGHARMLLINFYSAATP
jgi:hypothetical protein